MDTSDFLKVFILEDNPSNREIIVRDLSEKRYLLHFFSKNDSIIELLAFNPDIVIQDYFKNKVTNCYQWSEAY
jgi:CheY-like chemotaxis protein